MCIRDSVYPCRAAAPTTQPDLSTPKSAALAWARAVSAGDMDAVRQAPDGTDKELALARNLSDYILAAQQYNAALVKEFGDDAKTSEVPTRKILGFDFRG